MTVWKAETKGGTTGGTGRAGGAAHGSALLKILLVAALAAAGVLAFVNHGTQQEVKTLRAEKEASCKKVAQLKEATVHRQEDSDRLFGALLKDSDAQVRVKALEVVALKQPERLAALLPRFLATEKETAQILVLLSLAGRHKVGAAFDAVRDKLATTDPSVRRKAAAVLGEMAEALSTEQREEAGAALVEAVKQEKAALAREQRKAGFGIFLPYVDALGKLNSTQSARELLEFLRVAEEPMLRRAAAAALRPIVQAQHEKSLKAAWRAESDATVRLAIEEILTCEPFNLTVDQKRKVLISKKKE